MARVPRAADLRPSLSKRPPGPSDEADSSVRHAPTTPEAAPATPAPPRGGEPPDQRAAVSDTAQSAAAPLVSVSPLALDEVLRDVQLDTATIHVRWLPSTEVFDFRIDETTTVIALKTWLSAEVACGASHMHVDYAYRQLRDDVPLSQFVGHGDTVYARPKRGG